MTILNETITYEPSGLLIFLILLTGSIAVATFITMIVAIVTGEETDKSLRWTCLISFLATAFLILMAYKTVKNEICREVLLDDKYPAVKLLEEYNILEQHGEIYKVQLKDADKSS